MDATALFENTMELIRQRGVGVFAKEDDLVRDAYERIKREIAKYDLPYLVVREQRISRKRADLAILRADGSILVAAEFKYEPAHTGAMSSEDVVLWPEVEGDKGDIEKIKKYVGEDGVGVAYAILVDADGRWRRRHPNPPAGSEWRDWDNGVWALWTKVGGDVVATTHPVSEGS